MRTREDNREYMRLRRSGNSTARAYRKRGLDWSDPVVRAGYQKGYRRKMAGQIGRFEKLVAEYRDAVRIALKTKVKLVTTLRTRASFSDLEPRSDRHCGGYSHNGHKVGSYSL